MTRIPLPLLATALSALVAMTGTSFADALLEICPSDQPCTVKHRYELKSVCELDRASEANLLPPETKIECIDSSGKAHS